MELLRLVLDWLLGPPCYHCSERVPTEHFQRHLDNDHVGIRP